MILSPSGKLEVGFAADSTANFPIKAQKSARVKYSQYSCQKGSIKVYTIEVLSVIPLLSGSELKQPSGPNLSDGLDRSISPAS